MLEKGAIIPVAQVKGQFISNLFLREKKDGGHRPIINLKKLNAFIPYLKFKMESIKNIKDLLSKGDYMVKIDLKDAYFSIPLNHESRKFVRFKWEGNLYEFVCLTFGIGPAPRIFSRLLKVPISLIRKLKIRIVIYIDDMLVMAATLSEIEIARDTVIQIFQALGFVINFAKSDLTPKQIMEFLGIIVNSIEMTFSIPQAKIEKLTKISLEMLEKGEPSVRELSSIIGKLRATAPAFIHAPLQVRYLQLALIEAQHQGKTYAKTVKLNEKARLELQWWPENMEILNGKPINIQPPDLTISSDAARTGGWGAECNGQITGGVWNQEESNLHINVQELIAAQLALKTFTKLMKGSSVHLMIDNTSALSHLAKMGGTKNEMMIDLSKEIWSYLTSKQITLTLEWIPSKLNVEADWASRNWQDASEWKLDPLFFQKVCKTLGFPEIDAFASRTSHQLAKYFSWKPDPYSVATNAFQQDWTYKFLYAFPPFSLVGRCLRKAIRHQNRLLLITPVWVTQTWYPLLLEMTVRHPILLPQQKSLLKNPKGEFHPLLLNSSLRLAAWLVSGKVKDQQDFQRQLPTLSPELDPKELELVTTRVGESLVAGVVRGKLIHFHVI